MTNSSGSAVNELALTPAALVRRTYQRHVERLTEIRRVLNRPLTLAEKILYTHTRELKRPLRPGVDYGLFDPDRLAMPDSGAQMALLQLMTTGQDQVALPATIHCDHLVNASQGSQPDLAAAEHEHGEVYAFLESAAAKYGLGLWKPGSGIIHQVILENYAFPGGLLFATDSHTPNAGGLGMIAIGVGGADAVDAMVQQPISLRAPGLIGIHLSGSLSGWTAPKDIILEVASRLTVRGGTGFIVEYFGPGAESISATGKATICNMGAEIGATTSVFSFDEAMVRFLRATGREEIAALSESVASELRSDAEVWEDPESYYDQVIEIDLDTLEPLLSGPGTPDLVRPVAHMAEEAEKESYPVDLSYAMIGSCTNSSYEDIGRAADVARQARDAGVRTRTPLYVSPGSESVRRTMERDGLLADLEAIGATILANACGPCIGQWKRSDGLAGKQNSIITSFNRNFPRRNDGHSETLAFIASPELVVAAALSGRLDVDPRTVVLDGGYLAPPSAPELPSRGWITSFDGFVPPPGVTGDVTVSFVPGSDRLQPLEPFDQVDGVEYQDVRVLVKVAGKCTTDHISPAGRWLRYRGHLERLSDNTLLGARNAYTDKTGTGVDLLTGLEGPLHEIARHYKEAGVRWLIVGDDNFGEGSSREHAAMQIRYLGGLAVIARSFARIHETNLKKQGVLPLTFQQPDDYSRILHDDHIEIPDVSSIEPDTPGRVRLHHADGTSEDIWTEHSMDRDQLSWIAAGSAMNHLRHQSSHH